MKRTIFGILLSFLLAFTMMGVVPASAEGVLADNITWNVEGSVLTLSGSGEMQLEYEYLTETPWYEYRNSVDTLIVSEGITSIAEGAFSAFRALKNIQFPETMDIIGESAFLSCEGLETVFLPDRVTVIEAGAFTGCESLKTISIPGNTYQISDDAFYNCYNLTICGISGSFVEEFANRKNIPFDGSRALPADIMVTVNNEILWFDQPPVIINDRTLVPLRAIFEAMGATVDWEASTRTVSARRGSDSISLVVDTNVIVKNGVAIEIDVPAQIVGDRTMVPARAIAEALGASVDWNGSTRTVLIDD